MATTETGAGLRGLALRLSEVWALIGGGVLIAVVVVNVASVAGAAILSLAVPGDFELTELGVAIAAFSFLPYCQIAGKNVTADIFTMSASQWWLSVFGLLASLIALAFAAIMLWRMYAGMLDQKAYDYTTAILQIPVWWAFLPCLLSLALLAFAALATLIDGFGALKER